MQLFAHGVSDVGRERTQNEDSVQLVQYADGSWLLIVCDGVGGHEAGDVASAVAVATIREWFQPDQPNGPVRQLYDALMNANRSVVAEAAARGVHGMGTTAVVAYVRGRKAWVGWAGDSRLYQFRRGALIERTTDHTRVQRMVEAGVLTPSQAKEHPDAHVLTMALGAGLDVEFKPTVWDEPLHLGDGDILLLGSDGMYDLIDDPELYSLVAERDYRDGAQVLVDEANRRGGFDNVTVVLLVVGSARVPAIDPAASSPTQSFADETPSPAPLDLAEAPVGSPPRADAREADGTDSHHALSRPTGLLRTFLASRRSPGSFANGLVVGALGGLAAGYLAGMGGIPIFGRAEVPPQLRAPVEVPPKTPTPGAQVEGVKETPRTKAAVDAPKELPKPDNRAAIPEAAPENGQEPDAQVATSQDGPETAAPVEAPAEAQEPPADPDGAN